MKAVAALRLPLDVDLSQFVAWLRQQGVPHRVAEEQSQQVLWVPGDDLAAQVQQWYSQYPNGAALEPELPVAHSRSGLLAQLRQSPLTAAVLALVLVVFAATWAGENYAAIAWLTFVDFTVQGQQVYLNYAEHTLASGQWWRLITPMLIHFGWLHLAMNSLWYWELGRRVEYRQGALALLGLTLLLALASNVAQYLWAGPSLFGGLSGVLYGLLGHCWIYQRLAPDASYRLPPGVLVMMLVWLLICMTGIFELLQFGAIANAAHVGGLLAGCLTGLLGGALARRGR